MRRTALLLLITGCSDGKAPDDTASLDDSDSGTGTATPEVPDCSWFSEDNCWKSAVRAVDACLPTERAAGTLASNYQTCDFADGSRLNLSSSEGFSTPFEWSSLNLRGFQLTDTSGSVCISYLAEDEATTTSWTLATPEGEVSYRVEDLTAFGGLLTCPDGTIYDLGADVMSCPEANAHWPFISHAATGSSLTYSLQGGDEAVLVFTCADEAPAASD
jgi:hypothetical protein